MSVYFFLIGMSVGACAMWYHFVSNGLIRTREEWYTAYPDKRPKDNNEQR